MTTRIRPKVLLISSGRRRRDQVSGELTAEGYDVVSRCAGPDGDRHCAGMGHGSCGLTIGVDVVVLDVASINGVAPLQAFYASKGVPVHARGSRLPSASAALTA